MKRLATVLTLFVALTTFAFASPGGSTAYILVNDSPLYQDNPDKSLKWLEALTIGDKVTLSGRAATFKESGKDRDFTRVKAADGKEGWVRSQFLADGNGYLAVVKAEKAPIYSEPRDVKITSRSISRMTIVGVAPGPNESFSLVQGYDIAQGVLFTESTYVSSADLTKADMDLQAAILYTVAAASKTVAVKTNLLKLAASKYAGSVFIDKIQAALGAGAPAAATAPAAAAQAAPAASSAHVPVQLNKDAQGPDAVKTFYAVLSSHVPESPMKIKNVTATSYLTEKTMTHFPKHIADGDINTAWVEGAKGNGIGEKVTLFPEGSSAATGIWVLPGFAANETYWNTNNRAAVLTLRFVQVMDNGDYRVIDSHGTDRFVLKMQMVGGVVPYNQWQYFDLGQGLWGADTDVNLINGVMLEIASIDGKNSKYPDTCISEVALVQEAGASVSAQAQTASASAATTVYTSSDKRFSFIYPSSWQLKADNESAVELDVRVGTTDAAMDKDFSNPADVLASGEAWVRLGTGKKAEFAQGVQMPVDSSIVSLLTTLTNQPSSENLKIGQVQETTAGGFSAASVSVAEADRGEALVMIIDFGDGQLATLLGEWAAGERTEWEPAMLAIADSISYTTAQ